MRHVKASRRPASEEGFTLVELLIVMAILVLLAGVVGPRVLNYLGSSKSKAARIQIEALSTSLELYHLDAGHYPTSAEGLKALIEKPARARVWNGPYLKKSEIPPDPWGREYIYVSPGQRGPFELSTLGADGLPGGDGENADVTSWQ